MQKWCLCALVGLDTSINCKPTPKPLYWCHNERDGISTWTTCVSIVCTTVCSGADQRKYQSSAPLDFVRGIHRWPVNSPHKGPVTRKIFPYDGIIMTISISYQPFWCWTPRHSHLWHWLNRLKQILVFYEEGFQLLLPYTLWRHQMETFSA